MLLLALLRRRLGQLGDADLDRSAQAQFGHAVEGAQLIQRPRVRLGTQALDLFLQMQDATDNAWTLHPGRKGRLGFLVCRTQALDLGAELVALGEHGVHRP